MRWLSSATPSWFRHDQRGFVPGPVTRAVRMSIEMSSSKGVVIPSKLGVFGIGCICIHMYIYLYYNIILYYIVLYCIELYYIILYLYLYLYLYYIISYHIILYYIILYILYVSVVLDNVSELSLFYDVLWLIIGTVYVYMYIYIYTYTFMRIVHILAGERIPGITGTSMFGNKPMGNSLSSPRSVTHTSSQWSNPSTVSVVPVIKRGKFPMNSSMNFQLKL